MPSQNPKHTHINEIGERLGLNDSTYFKANCLTPGVPGVCLSLQTCVAIGLVNIPGLLTGVGL